MLNKIIRVVLGIIIAAAILVGIYLVLPGQYKNPITEKLQGITKDWTTGVVEDIKNIKMPTSKELKLDKTFGAAFSQYNNPSWIVDNYETVDDLGNGNMTVYGDTWKCTVVMESQMADDKNITFTNAHVRFVFNVSRQNGKFNKVELTKVMVNELEYTPDNAYYQLCIDSVAKGN